MNKRIRYSILTVAVLTAAVIFSSCFMGRLNSTMVTPEIRAIGLPDASIVDSVTLKVTGPGMDPVQVSYSSVPSMINLAVPEGNDRTFELIVGLSNAFLGAATSYKGTGTADINEDSTVITLNMGVGSTKIVVPDPEWFTVSPDPRLLQFDDVSGINEQILTGTQLGVITGDVGWSNNFYPYDVDYDGFGRIYIANNNASTDYGRVIRIDDIIGTGFFAFQDLATGITAVAIDRNRNILYYTTNNQLYSANLDGTSDGGRSLPVIGAATISNIRSISVDSNGMLYMIADVGQVSADYQVLKFDPLKNPLAELLLLGQSNTLPGNSSITPKDLLVKGDSIYVANSGGGNGYQILQLSTTDLVLIDHYGDQAIGQDTSVGKFYGPRRFVAQLNDSITIIDDMESDMFDKIIQMDDISGTNWSTFPQGMDDGQLEFLFFFFGGA